MRDRARRDIALAIRPVPGLQHLRSATANWVWMATSGWRRTVGCPRGGGAGHPTRGRAREGVEGLPDPGPLRGERRAGPVKLAEVEAVVATTKAFTSSWASEATPTTATSRTSGGVAMASTLGRRGVEPAPRAPPCARDVREGVVGVDGDEIAGCNQPSTIVAEVSAAIPPVARADGRVAQQFPGLSRGRARCRQPPGPRSTCRAWGRRTEPRVPKGRVPWRQISPYGDSDIA